MIDFGVGLKAILLENPVDLFFLAPKYIPIIVLSLFPLSIIKSTVDAVSKSGLEFDIVARCARWYGGVG